MGYVVVDTSGRWMKHACQVRGIKLALICLHILPFLILLDKKSTMMTSIQTMTMLFLLLFENEKQSFLVKKKPI